MRWTLFRHARLFLMLVPLLSGPGQASVQAQFTEPLIELGTLLQQDQRDVSISIDNKSTEAMTVTRLKVDCACLVLPAAQSFRIPAGGRHKLVVKLKTGMLRGTHRQSITAFYGPRGAEQCRTEVRFNIQPDVSLSPWPLQLGPVRPGAVLDRIIVVQGRPGIAPEIELAGLPQGVKATLESQADGEEGSGKRWRLALTIQVPKDARPGRFERVVKLKISGARIDGISAHILADIETDLRVRPRRVDFGRVDPAVDNEKTVVIESETKRSFKILRAVDTTEAFVDYGDAGSARHKVTLQLPKGLQPGAKRGVIKLITDHPEVPLIEIRYRALVMKGKK